jgi:hypothetical protein
MSEFFVRRPIVAIVIAILMTLIGGVCILALPIAQYPQIAPPEIQVQTHYTGADALDDRAIGRGADRAADERRRQHELHVLDQRE